MPDQCTSCGAHAVIQDELDGGGDHRICIECGTVATGPRSSHTVGNNGQAYGAFSNPDDIASEVICESCGDQLPYSLSLSATICSECQELEVGLSGMKDEKETTASETVEENGSASDSQPSCQRCKSCGGTNLSHESIGADERLVCCDCGTVAGGEILTSDQFDVTTRSFGNNIPTLPVFAGQRRKCRGITAGHQKITYLQNKFCFPEMIKTDAEEMYDKIFYKPHVLYAHVSTKLHLAAACVLIVCRIHDIPVCMNHFSPYVDKFTLFIRATKIILKSLNINLPHVNLSSQVGHLLLNHGFSSPVISKVKEILFLCRRAWLTQGRSREGLIIIAAYYAYRSTEATSDLTMVQFRKKFRFPSNNSLVLQAEISNMFLKLARNIPWVPARCVKPTTIHRYIDDILKYQNSLFQLAFKSQDSDEISTSHDQTVAAEKGKIHAHKLKTSKKCREQNRAKRTFTAEKEELLPSIMKKKRQEAPLEICGKVSHLFDLDSPVLKAAEFDENEISSYILTPEEEEIMKTPKLKIVSP